MIRPLRNGTWISRPALVGLAVLVVLSGCMKPPRGSNQFAGDEAGATNTTGGTTSTGIPYTRAGEDPNLGVGEPAGEEPFDDGTDPRLRPTNPTRIDRTSPQRPGASSASGGNSQVTPAQMPSSKAQVQVIRWERESKDKAIQIVLKIDGEPQLRQVRAQNLDTNWRQAAVARVVDGQASLGDESRTAKVRCLSEPSDRTEMCREIWVLIHKKSAGATRLADESSPAEIDLVVRDLKMGAVLRFGQDLGRETETACSGTNSKNPRCEFLSGLKKTVSSDTATTSLKTWEVRSQKSEYELKLGPLCVVGPLLDTSELDFDSQVQNQEEQIRYCSAQTKQAVGLVPVLVGNATTGEILLSLEDARFFNQQRAAVPNRNESVSERDPFLEKSVLVHVTRSKTGRVREVLFRNDPVFGVIPVPPEDDEDEQDQAEEPAARAPVRQQPGVQAPERDTKPVRPPVVVPPVAPYDGPQRPNGQSHWLMNFDWNNRWTQVFLKDRRHRHVVQAMHNMRNVPGQWPQVEDFATHFPLSSTIVTDILNRSGVPSEFALLMVHESAFFRSNKFAIGIGGDGEVGPWQLMLGTAKDFGLKNVFSAQRPNYNFCDDRADLLISTEAVARKLNQMLRYFPHDPKLAVLSFNTGAGGAGQYAVKEAVSGKRQGEINMRKIEMVASLGRDYWKARELRSGVAARPQAGGYGYVERFVAVMHHLIEMNPPQNPKTQPRMWTVQDSPVRTKCRR